MARKLTRGAWLFYFGYFGALGCLLFWLFTNSAEAADVRVCWTAPTENTDGSPLTDLDGFFIYWANTSGGPYTDSVRITDSSRRCKTLDLNPGTYYLVGTAYNEANIQSEFSLEIERVIAPPPKVPNPPSDFRTN